MRRTTAAALGTVTGAALIMAARLSVAPAGLAAPPPADLVADGANATQPPSPDEDTSPRKPSKKKPRDDDGSSEQSSGGQGADASTSGLRAGRFTGKAVNNPYGTVRVAITVSDGRIADVAASYPNAGQSAEINGRAIPRLKRETLAAQSAEVDAVSGATYTSKSYVESLQAALDAAKA